MTQKAREDFDKIRLERLMQMRDTDRDNVPDAYDCKPLDPNRDGFFGDVFRRVTRTAKEVVRRAPIHPSRARAAQRRAAVRRAVTPSIRRVTRTAKEVVRRAPIHPSRERAARRRESVRRKITHAVKPVTERIRDAKEFVALPATARSERVKIGAEKFLETQQARTRRMSDISMRIHKGTARVATVVRGFEKPVMQRVAQVEEAAGVRVPKPIKEFAAGVAFGAPAAMVEMAGMVPGGVETLVKHPRVLPAAAAYGAYEMGRGMWKGITERPIRTAGEFVGMGAISRGAPRTIGKPYEAIRFRGKEFVSPETIAEKAILTGKKQFPTISSRVSPAARPAITLKTFRESLYKLPHERPGEAGWHATAAKFTKEAEAAVGARPTTAPGLHVAPSASTHFLRLPKKSSQITFFGVPSLARSHPALLRIGVEAFERMPRRVREAGEAARVRFIYEKKGVPKAYISPAMEAGKTELEAIIAPGTPLVRKHFRYYTTIEGKKVPIYEYKAIHGGRMSNRGLTMAELTRKQAKATEEYYHGVTRRHVVTPASYALPYHKPDHVMPPMGRYYHPPATERRVTPPSPEYRVPPSPEYRVPPSPEYRVPPSPEYRVPPPPLPKIKEEDDKHPIRKRRKAKPEYWRIKNPIASIQQMMFGRVVQKPPATNKKE